MAAKAGPTTCPKCRLLNPPGSEGCDCGYQFATGRVVTRSAAAKRTAEPRQVRDVARAFQALLSLIGFQVLVAAGRLIGRMALEESPDAAALTTLIAGIVAVGVSIAAAVQARRLAEALRLDSPGAYMIGSLLPCVNVGVLLVLSSEATTWCRDRGILVNLLGPKV